MMLTGVAPRYDRAAPRSFRDESWGERLEPDGDVAREVSSAMWHALFLPPADRVRIWVIMAADQAVSDPCSVNHRLGLCR
jgi:hypothetical protein